MRAGFFGAMDTAIDLATSFDAVTDYLAITMGTGRCQHVNRAFEAVKGPGFSTGRNLKRLVVIVPANIALSHNASWLISTGFRLCAPEWPRGGTRASGLCAKRAYCPLLRVSAE
jgi:hypothetical protein